MATKNKTIKSYKDFDIILRQRTYNKKVKTTGWERFLENIGLTKPSYNICYSFKIDAVATSKEGLGIVEKLKDQLKNER